MHSIILYWFFYRNKLHPILNQKIEFY